MIGTDRQTKIVSLKELLSEPRRVTFKLTLSFLQCCSSSEFIAVVSVATGENSINPFLRLECPPSSPDWHRRRRSGHVISHGPITGQCSGHVISSGQSHLSGLVTSSLRALGSRRCPGPGAGDAHCHGLLMRISELFLAQNLGIILSIMIKAKYWDRFMWQRNSCLRLIFLCLLGKPGSKHTYKFFIVYRWSGLNQHWSGYPV